MLTELSQPDTAHIQQLRELAFRLFKDGQYFDADDVLAELADMTPEDREQIAIRRAQIGMLSDRMDDVETQLNNARNTFGRHVYYVGLEADMAVRRGDLKSAAASFRRMGRHSRAEQLEGFAGNWYQVDCLSSAPVTWHDAHALPLFEVSVNGQTGRFILDTGTGDCLLDSDFARRANITPGPLDQASFAGGRAGHWQLCQIETLAIGSSQFSKLPAMVTQLSHAFEHGFVDTQVDGIIGAGLIRAAGGIDINYPLAQFKLGSPGLQDGEPLWIAGPHYPLTPCRVNGRPASSWFIDSGMSGVDLACSESAALRHGAVPLDHAIEAHGGGGILSAKAVLLKNFEYADLHYPNVPAAVLDNFTLGRDLGIRIGGLIGHEWLSRHRVQLDYQSMQTRIWHDNNQPKSD